MTFPCPVGKKCTTDPAAAHNVTISAAADDESMKLKPGFRGSCAGSRKSTIVQRPAFWMFPRAFSSIVVSPPRMLPSVGWDPTRLTPCDSTSAW